MSDTDRGPAVAGDRPPPEDPTVELLWFSDCPNHEAARRLVHTLIDQYAPGVTLRDIDAKDPALAAAHRFPGSPTIRVNGIDVDPGYVDPGDYTPRCRLYRTAHGLRGVPEPEWVQAAIVRAIARSPDAGRGTDPPPVGD